MNKAYFGIFGAAQKQISSEPEDTRVKEEKLDKMTNDTIPFQRLILCVQGLFWSSTNYKTLS